MTGAVPARTAPGTSKAASPAPTTPTEAQKPPETPKVPKTPPAATQEPEAAAPPVSPAAPEAGVKEPWDMTQEEWVEQQGKLVSGQTVAKTKKLARLLHKDHVKIWLAEGKPVSPEALAKYPDLASPAPEAQAEEVTPSHKQQMHDLAALAWKRGKKTGGPAVRTLSQKQIDNLIADTRFTEGDVRRDFSAGMAQQRISVCKRDIAFYRKT